MHPTPWRTPRPAARADTNPIKPSGNSFLLEIIYRQVRSGPNIWRHGFAHSCAKPPIVPLDSRSGSAGVPRTRDALDVPLTLAPDYSTSSFDPVDVETGKPFK